ncbi:MAG: ACP S-malonyltransferase [Syntrophaceae bacterium]|nr:ACP S-malonyltransferase [Syntrophaceae bacterium]
MKAQLVFLYPGQGSQQVGMGRDLYERHREARRIFDRADRILGSSLSRLCFEGPERELNQDLAAQLAVFTLGCALTAVLEKKNILPEAASGYSSGFYAAAYAAGCFDFGTGLRIVKRAGEILLEEARKTKGCMAVIFGLSREEIEGICSETEGADVAILNTARQTVISGREPAVKKVMAVALKEGALDAYTLSLSAAYHSSFMAPAGSLLLKELKDIPVRRPEIPLFSYHTLKRVNGAASLKMIMATQLSRPVLWADLIKTIHRPGRLFVEIGSGDVIARTVRWIDRNMEIVSVSDTQDILKLWGRL